jgi:hypothetical protein
MTSMPIMPARRIFRLRYLMALLWACLPALLVYSSLHQVPLYSRMRMVIAILVFLFFLFIGYYLIGRLALLGRNRWLGLLAVSILWASFGSIALSFFPEETFLFSPRHTLKIQVLNLKDGQTLAVRSLETSLGPISYGSFQDLTGWQRSGGVLVPISSSPHPLIWTGWTGDVAVLHFSGSSGVKLNVSWDGQSTMLDLGQAHGNVISSPQRFTMPLWSKVFLALVLGGTMFYGAAILLQVSQYYPASTRQPRLPTWLDAGVLTALASSLLSSSAFSEYSYGKHLCKIGNCR